MSTCNKLKHQNLSTRKRSYFIPASLNLINYSLGCLSITQSTHASKTPKTALPKCMQDVYFIMMEVFLLLVLVAKILTLSYHPVY